MSFLDYKIRRNRIQNEIDQCVARIDIYECMLRKCRQRSMRHSHLTTWFYDTSLEYELVIHETLKKVDTLNEKIRTMKVDI